MRTILTYALLIVSFPLFSFDKNFQFHEITAKNGDGVFSLLRAYQLDKAQCNHEQFYKLNQLQPSQGLLRGRKYKLPLLKFRYNGKSIRSTLDSNDLQFAIKIKNYNEQLVATGLKASNYPDDLELLVPYNFLNCADDPSLPSDIANARRIVHDFEIFGPSYRNTEIIDNNLRGQVFYVVAGHGGPDPGSLGRSNGNRLCEDEYAYDVALRLTRLLVSHGATAYMINRDKDDGIRDEQYLECDYDEVLIGDIKMSTNQIRRLRQRSNAVNKLYDRHKKQKVKSQKLISIHIDSRHKNQKADVFFYHHTKSIKGNHLADQMMDTFDQKYKKYQSTRGYSGKVQGRDLHILRESKPLSVFVELGNIKNPFDQKRFLIVDNRKLLAEWLFEGLTAN
ncbi:MAG: N-acetylmuramoyl-L-alanine amidase [Bacteroidia bacterium]|nr:N-acetylmuramoyl-L-alanine amidase [Bacteroidia bacterium]